MGFIKRNLFLVIVGVATVIVGMILLISSYGKSGVVGAQKALREQVAGELENLARSRANLPAVQAERQRVREVRQRAREINEKIVEWNSKRFGILKVPKRDAENKVEMVPAFPIDRRLYNKYALAFEVTKKYIEEIRGLLKELEATHAPTDGDIQAAVDKARHRLKASGRGRVMNAARNEAARLGGAVPVGPAGRGFAPQPALAGEGGAIRAPMGKGSTKSIDEQAKREGFETAVLFRSRAGVTYATLGSFDMVFPVEQVGATDVELWHSLVNLLVQKDIVGAIRETNNMAMRRDTANPKRPQVSAAAVKRLMSVNVDENYYVSAATETASSPLSSSRGRGRRTGPPPGGPAELGGYGGGYPGQFGGPGGIPGGFGGGFGGGIPGGGGAPGTKGISLTSRSTNSKFDVIHYNFTVIMPMRYLPLLMKNLQGRSYHTILKIDLAAVKAAAVRSNGQVKGPTAGNRYYFGTDPVMKVTIYGEFVMLADWSRGRWLPDEVIEVNGRKKRGAWSARYPPLMPVAVLRGLRARKPGILRQEDLARLQQSMKMQY